MARDAPKVSVAPVAEKRAMQGLLEEPAVLMQAETTSASVLISASGTVTPAGTLAPPAEPTAVLASNAALAKAFTRPVGLEPVAPMWAKSDANGARAYAAAMVLTSLITM